MLSSEYKKKILAISTFIRDIVLKDVWYNINQVFGIVIIWFT